MGELSTVVLRDYQQRLARAALEALIGHSRVVVACPTGSGKTVVAMNGILQHLPRPVAWVTHRRELANQARAYGCDVDVFMAQAGLSGTYSSIIIDEGHHVCAAQYREILDAHPKARVIALTATPYRLDGVGLGSCGFSALVYGPDTYELTVSGALCAVRVLVPASESTSAWLPAAASLRIAKCSFSKGIVFCRTVDAAKELACLLSAAGVPAASIDGATDRHSRSAAFTKFESGEIKVMCNHTVFTEGVDVPDVDLVVLNRHTLSRCLWKQMIGRGTRNAPGKTVCTVMDLAGNSMAHGSIYDKELYDLNGKVAAIEARSLGAAQYGAREGNAEYLYNQGEELKEWKPKTAPVSLFASLRRLSEKSPLRRLKTVL